MVQADNCLRLSSMRPRYLPNIRRSGDRFIEASLGELLLHSLLTPRNCSECSDWSSSCFKSSQGGFYLLLANCTYALSISKQRHISEYITQLPSATCLYFIQKLSQNASTIF